MPNAIPHARDDAPWSGPSPAWFPETWGTLFATETCDPDTVALYYDRDCERHFACHAAASPLSPEIVLSGRRFDVVHAKALVRARAA